jgi:hypothetical protein
MLNHEGIYEFRGYAIGPVMIESIRDYVNHGAEPGSFLSAVICNNLKEAVACADDTNLANLPAFVSFFYNEVPSNIWGTSEKMIRHMAAKAVERIGA